MSELRTHYLACWNETDDAARRALVEQHWAEHLRYVDPMVEVVGHDALAETIGAVHQQFPGFVFTAVGDIDTHHDQARFQWGLGPAGDEPVVIGSDVVVLDADGRIERVYGFLDRVPA